MSEKIPFYWYPYAASVATAEDPDCAPPEEEEAEEPDLSLEAEGVQDVVVGVSHWVDGTPRVELDLLVLQRPGGRRQDLAAFLQGRPRPAAGAALSAPADAAGD